ncbi:hypothetical protein F5B22DRAFT_648182 [Xylaria bambusicola]|uniref:uncharacterized protein n=1 Tax=Xylaria bambusicola TaxID=326684 RepID=UPI002007A367|nr:uncharacterized protein F5B22DRAFT_648182 [Xylaria bambusicola]KAI0513086.1 hypothetical protein F5B22DRAFT_648182 [Xylaria bambusicola]
MASVSETVQSLIRRSEFWLTVPGMQRYRFWETDSPNRVYSFTAADLVQFTKTNCLAKANPNSSDVSEFKNEMQADLEANKANPYTGTTLAQSVANCLVWIDRLFFFGIITQQDKRKDESDHRSLITLSFGDHCEEPEMKGVFIPSQATLWVNLDQPSGEPEPFDEIFCVMVHELCHVYLGILTKDSNASRYHTEIQLNNGHGVQFQELLHFILAQLFAWFPMIPRLGELAAVHQEALQNALAQPIVSETIARSRIYACSDTNVFLADVLRSSSKFPGVCI